ncbi:LOG family protein [Shigella flexneri]
MKGARSDTRSSVKDSRFIGMTEPSIIAAEPPNPLVNELIIMQISKNVWNVCPYRSRYHFFPGGVGTAEELLYLLGILMNPANKDQVLPLILTGPKRARLLPRTGRVCRTYAGRKPRAITRHHDDAAEVARQMKESMPLVKKIAATLVTLTAWLVNAHCTRFANAV